MSKFSDSSHFEKVYLVLSVCAEYYQRNPKESLLYNIFAEGLPAFLSAIENNCDKKALPQYVINELEAFLKCRVPEASGVSRWRCDGACKHEIFIAHSCKKRGFCPSCGGRRMSQTAANLKDFVIPKVPIRQWVISLPMELRFWVAKDPNLLDAVNTIINREISRFYKERAISDGVLKPHTGALAFIQRAGGQINLNPHWHILYVEGCYDEGIEGVRGPRFYEQKKPTSLDIAGVAESISRKIIKHLIKIGYLKAEEDFCELTEIEDESMDIFHKTSIYGYIATGENEGQRVRRLIRNFDLDGKAEITSSRCVNVNGFSVHADTFVKKHEHQQRERLIRYVARPPISEKRMELDENGEVIWHLKNIFSDLKRPHRRWGKFKTECLKFSFKLKH